jgi:hypothetical protein
MTFLFQKIMSLCGKWNAVSDHVKVHKFEQMPVLHFSPISITTPVSPTFDQSNVSFRRVGVSPPKAHELDDKCLNLMALSTLQPQAESS